MAIPTVLFGIFFYLRLGQLNAREKANQGGAEKKKGHITSRPESMRRIVLFLILSTFTAAIIMSIVSFIPLLMVDHFHLSKRTAASLLSLIYVAVFWASPLGGYLSDRFGSIRVTLAICFIAGPVIILFTVLPYGLGIYALLILLGTVIFARMSASETFIVSNTPPGSRSTILGHLLLHRDGGGRDTDAGSGLRDRPSWVFRRPLRSPAAQSSGDADLRVLGSLVGEKATEEGESMIKHVVLAKFKPGVTAADIAR